MFNAPQHGMQSIITMSRTTNSMLSTQHSPFCEGQATDNAFPGLPTEFTWPAYAHIYKMLASMHATPFRSLHLLDVCVSALILLALLSLSDCGVRPQASASQRKYRHYDGCIPPVLWSCEVAQGEVGSLHSLVSEDPNLTVLNYPPTVNS